jgi:hypothetical protein
MAEEEVAGTAADRLGPWRRLPHVPHPARAQPEDESWNGEQWNGGQQPQEGLVRAHARRPDHRDRDRHEDGCRSAEGRDPESSPRSEEAGGEARSAYV